MWRPRTLPQQWLSSRRALEHACRLVVLLALVCALSACGGGGGSEGDDGAPPNDDAGLPPVSAFVVDVTEVDSGGGNTVSLSNVDAFSQSNPQLGLLDQGKFESGDSEFERPRQGLLGPLFNNGTCEGCHKKDGRGNPPRDADGDGETDQHMSSMLMRLSIPIIAPTNSVELVVVRNGVQPEPVYGGQIQVRGGLGTPGRPSVHNGALFPDGTPSDNSEDVVGEAFVSILYESLTGQYADGTSYSLHQPTYRIRDLAYGPFCGDDPDCREDDVQFSPRVASQVIGLGLLETIPEADILRHADPQDANDDGISGRPNRVWDVWTETLGHLGRFGHKASKPTLLHQLAAAYLGDIGITSSLFPDDTCTLYQPACEALADQQTPSTTVVIPYHESGVAGNDNTGLAIDGAAATCTKPTRVRPHAAPAPPNARANVVSPPHSEPDPRPNQRPDPRLTRRPHQAPRRFEAQQTAQRRAFFFHHLHVRRTHRTQQRQRPHRQGDVTVPARPTTNFVLIETHVILSRLKTRLDAPTSARHRYQRRHVRPAPRVHPIGRQLALCSQSLIHKSSGDDIRRMSQVLVPSDPSHHEAASGQLHPG